MYKLNESRNVPRPFRLEEIWLDNAFMEVSVSSSHLIRLNVIQQENRYLAKFNDKDFRNLRFDPIWLASSLTSLSVTCLFLLIYQSRNKYVE